MDDLLNPLLLALKSVNPLLYVAALVVLALFGDKLRGLLGKFKLPTLTPKPVAPADPKADPDRWLEDNPLLDRIWRLAKEKFREKVLTGKVSEDDLYVAVVKAIKDAEVDEDE